MKEFKHIGSYGLILDNDSIVLIKKVGGPYNGKLDLPGGTIEWGEKPEETLIRELEEEVGIKVKEYELFDGNSITFEWTHKGKLERGHHIGLFYKINKYDNKIKSNIEISDKNDDSLGAKFYNIKKLKKEELSSIALEIESKNNKNPEEVINHYINILGLNIKDAYRLSWDDKYTELCKEQRIKHYNHVTFDSIMPEVKDQYL